MTISRRGALGAALATTLAASLPARSFAQAAAGAQGGTGNWPSKPIRIIVPYPPGGSPMYSA